MRIFLLGFLSFFTLNCQAQELEYRSIEYYFDQIATLERNELIKQNVLIDSLTIADKYRSKETNGLNHDGFMKYSEIKMNIYLDFFNGYLYQQHVEYKNNVYVLYFTMAGFDDIMWDIVKWNKNDWKNEDKLSPEKLSGSSTITRIFGNYDEGPKNIENIRLFIQNHYLVFKRGNLYHSLFDLKADSLLYNEESPWHVSNGKDKKAMNEWIKVNLHDKIQEILICK